MTIIADDPATDKDITKAILNLFSHETKQNRARINVAVVNYLQEHGMPWEVSRWTADVNAQGPPANVVTDQRYIGIATLFMDMAAKEKDYLSKYWALAEDWQKLGITVQGNPHEIPYECEEGIQWCSMWNADQLPEASEYQCLLTEDLAQDQAPWANLEKLFNDCGPTLVHNRRDYPIYTPPEPFNLFPCHTSGDVIDAPELYFCLRGQSQYWTNLIHELCHWAEVRIGWCAEDQAQREFVAEMASAHLMRMHNCPFDNDCYNFTEWRDRWCHALLNHPTWISYAVDYADQIVRFILSQIKR